MPSADLSQYDLSTPGAALNAAVAAYGSQAAMARACGVSQPTVWAWVRKGQLPTRHVILVETETGISRHLLDPICYPRDLATDAASGVMEPVR